MPNPAEKIVMRDGLLVNQRHELFCQNIAKGLSATESYSKAGYTGKGPGNSAFKLLRNPQIASRITNLRAEIAQACVASEIANREWRVARLHDRAKRLDSVMHARADKLKSDPDAAGGASGLIVHQVKMIGRGEEAQIVHEYVIDAGMLREMREHEKQAAMELGQWTEKREMTGNDGGPLSIDFFDSLISGDR